MFGISMPELILILAIALIIVGPKKLPEIAKTLGRIIGDFKRYMAEFKDSFDVEDEIKDAKQTFDDINNNVKSVIGVKSSREKKSEAEQNQKFFDSGQNLVAKKDIKTEFSNKKKEFKNNE